MAELTRRMFLMGGVAFFPYIYLERLCVAVRRYRVEVRGLPASFKGFTILHISDLHEKEFGKGGEELIRLIGKERFDMVALTGDLVIGHEPSLTPALDLVAGIKRISGSPLYSVSGNHDWMLERGRDFQTQLRKAGAQVLSNSSASIERGEERLWIVGVEDPITRRDRLDLALQATDRDAPRLLLSHSPHPYPQAVKHGIDLMLAGHTHGGQVRLPFLGACFIPAMGFFPRWDYGQFTTGQSTLIVSGGLGESAVPVRFNIRPEVSLITLVHPNSPA